MSHREFTFEDAVRYIKKHEQRLNNLEKQADALEMKAKSQEDTFKKNDLLHRVEQLEKRGK